MMTAYSISQSKFRDSGMSGRDARSGARHRIGLWRGWQPRILRHLFVHVPAASPLTQIQLSLVVICALLSIVVGVVIWLVIRGIVRPIERRQRPQKHHSGTSICALP